VHLSSFITACAGRSLDLGEIVGLTKAMVAVGERLDWGRRPIAGKHSVGGLPGNRTTPIVVAITAACGLAAHSGRVAGFDNRVLARIPKLSGAPNAKEAGIELYVHVGDLVQDGQPVYTVHSAAKGELAYALGYAAAQPDVIRLEPA
jgi:thymidine phosphorylase